MREPRPQEPIGAEAHDWFEGPGEERPPQTGTISSSELSGDSKWLSGGANTPLLTWFPRRLFNERPTTVVFGSGISGRFRPVVNVALAV
jgi:hypothetical protein